jgi:hypothetical protein
VILFDEIEKAHHDVFHDLEGSTRNQAALAVTQAGITASTTCALE